MTDLRLLIPVSESVTLRNTVAYAVRHALERTDENDGSVAIHFVYPLTERPTFDPESEEAETAHTLLDRVTVWAQEDIEDDANTVTIETAVIGAEEYLFSPGDYANVLVQYARNHDLDVAVFDPGFSPLGTTPLLPPLEAEVQNAGLDVREAPVQRERRSPPLARRGTVTQFLTLFGVSYVFYLLLGGSFETYNLVTGVISAGVVSVALWRVSLTSPVRPVRAAKQLGRLALYLPYLVGEIAKGSVHVAYVVLHPDLPIDPEVTEFDAAVWSTLSITTYANSITLTPGTLTVNVSQRRFTVHSLTSTTREDLLDGALERAVRFVFYGRAAMDIPSPRDRMNDEDESQ
ncbi:monovalent cation/H+ antiporter subunit E [Halocatena salina]|uniref:Monovalent cation/H+ antiporter subunit E n=1 Tax=Halocatena salina TaxID=2934340 RepID=A0A8U0A466_9EURY|nr:monovalent cation/H+ antiporter subunit E [Halocatena salina]UPM43882.1 monovalent cation/H+ antiporter subunit E [Halocatena salina]